MEKKCPMCGAPMEKDKCTYCGYTENVETKKEKNISRPSGQAKTEQPKDGQKPAVNKNAAAPGPETTAGVSGKSKMAAMCLCIFFGMFGAHRFYVGQTGMGILYLCTAGLCGLGWIYDIVLIASNSFKDVYGLTLK